MPMTDFRSASDGGPRDPLERWIASDNPLDDVMRAFDKGIHGEMYSAEQLESMRIVGCPPVPNEDQRRWNGVREVLRLARAALRGDGPAPEPSERAIAAGAEAANRFGVALSDSGFFDKIEAIGKAMYAVDFRGAPALSGAGPAEPTNMNASPLARKKGRARGY